MCSSFECSVTPRLKARVAHLLLYHVQVKWSKIGQAEPRPREGNHRARTFAAQLPTTTSSRLATARSLGLLSVTYGQRALDSAPFASLFERVSRRSNETTKRRAMVGL